jgi:AraC family transcriptional regulator of adaptative response/methylated-DNA-[protein]-cysteine methyltransferase
MPRHDLPYAIARCRLGRVLVAAGPGGVRAILLGGTEAALRRELLARFPAATPREAPASLARQLGAALAMIEAPSRPPALSLDPAGSAFQRRVWRALGRVAPGETVTYGELARLIGRPRAARAVAGACAANPCAVAIPCHRVVPRAGGVGGYRWGAARKRALLAREAAA